MPDLHLHERMGPGRVFWLGHETAPFQSLKSNCAKNNLLLSTIDQSQKGDEPENADCCVLLSEISSEDFETKKEFLIQWKASQPATSVVILSEGLSTENLEALVNDCQVFAVLEKGENVWTWVNKALIEFQDQYHYLYSITKLKNQNSQLELLKKNLEELVLERTKKDYQSSQQALDKLKRIQELLRFIKQVARAETIEDLMAVVRKDFKKFHSLRPPMLIFAESNNLVRVFYFQGKQFTEKRHYLNSVEFLEKESEDVSLRKELSDLFGRPFGPIETVHLDFKSSEMPTPVGIIVLEHSLRPEAVENFNLFSVERWPIVTLAIENLLLKDQSELIARQWAKTFNEMHDPILIVDKDYSITLANSQLSETKEGVCYKEFAGRTKPCLDCPIQKTFESGTGQSSNIHCQGKVFQVLSYPIHLAGVAKATHVINQYVDITQSKDLQSRVIQGEKMAAIGLLAGNVAHELNNPLTGIQSLADLLLDDIDSESTTYKDLTEVRDASIRCQVLIKDLLEFSSVDSASQAQSMGVNSMIQKTLPMLKMAMRNHNNSIYLHDKELLVSFNPQLFQQVVFNLVNNACQAMENGGDLIVKTSRSAKGCLISIKDTGPGIPEHVKDHIFEPFFTTKDAGAGTGLGLSMSRSVVEKFGGTLELNDEYEEGTEFIISIPLISEESEK